MSVSFFLLQVFNGLSFGLILFLLSAGLTVVFSMLGVMNFAHASMYVLGAYLAYQLAQWGGFALALIGAPILVMLVGLMIERWFLRPVYRAGHTEEMLVTYILGLLILELIQSIWGRTPLPNDLPLWLLGPAFSLEGVTFPMYRLFILGCALVVYAVIVALARYRQMGLLVSATVSHPQMVAAMGYNVPLIRAWVFAAGAFLAGLSGVLAAGMSVTEPTMGQYVGALAFVIVMMGGLGGLVSLKGSLWAALLIGVVQTFAVLLPWTLFGSPLSRWAALLPFAFLVGVLWLRPQGLAGQRSALMNEAA